MNIKKRLSIFFVMFLFLLELAAGAFSKTQKFDISSVADIDVKLMFENLTVSTWEGNQIVIISEASKKDILPLVTCENMTLQIASTYPINKSFDEKSFCEISLMLPKNYVAEKASIKARYNKLEIKKLDAKTVIITPGSENILSNITADYFEIPLPDETDINISNLDCNSFNITLIVGDANISLSRPPVKASKLSVKEGNLKLSIPDASSFTIHADSYHSRFINNYDGSVTDWVRDGITYKHNGGGSEINIKTFKGDITIGSE